MSLALLGDVLVVLGLVVMTVGVYGLYRMPDVYTQVHASSKAVFLGVIALLAASVATRDGATVARAVLTAVFLTLTTPVAGHIAARAAYRAGERMETPGAVDESGSGLTRDARRGGGGAEREHDVVRADVAYGVASEPRRKGAAVKRLEGRVALVTGAASGIGRVTAERLAGEGAVAVVTDVQDEAGEATAEAIRDDGGHAAFLHLDVTDEDGWKTVVERVLADHGHLDILVNNAGLGDLAPIEETTLADWERTVAIDQTGVFLGMKSCGEALKASGHGSVINISSIFGTSGGFGTSPAYHAAKGAVRTLTKNVALHWATEGVRVNSVHPGFIRTPILDQAKGTEVWDAMTAMTPMGRLGEPAEIAAAVAYLASDDASFVTGLELYVDGGYIAR